MRDQAEPISEISRRRANRVDWTLRGALGATAAALLYVTISHLPSNQEIGMATPTPKTEKVPSEILPRLLPLSDILDNNLKAGGPFREFALKAFHLQGYETSFQRCNTNGQDVAIGTVTTESPIRTLPSEITPALASFRKDAVFPYRLAVLIKHWSSNIYERWIGIEDGYNLNYAPAIYQSTEYIKNKPGTTCRDIPLPELTLR